MAVAFLDDRDHQLAGDVAAHHDHVHFVELAGIDELPVGALRAVNIRRKEQAG